MLSSDVSITFLGMVAVMSNFIEPGSEQLLYSILIYMFPKIICKGLIIFYMQWEEGGGAVGGEGGGGVLSPEENIRDHLLNNENFKRPPPPDQQHIPAIISSKASHEPVSVKMKKKCHLEQKQRQKYVKR